MAWESDRPEAGKGVVQAFRGPEGPCESARFVLCSLDTAATYEVRDVETEGTCEPTGRELIGKGLLVTIPTRPGDAIILYRRVE